MAMTESAVSSGVRRKAAKGVFELFREINAMGMTILMATQDLALVRSHPEYRVVELAQGSIVYDSAAAALETERA